MPIGTDDFAKVRESYYFVDKTKIIRQLIDDHNEVTLFTRPRRFGKTLTMSMIDYFFSIHKKEVSLSLFRGLSIENAGFTYMQHRGTYPVIFLTLKECAEDSWENMYEQFMVTIQIEFQKHRYLLDSPLIHAEEKLQIQQFLTCTATPIEYKRSLWYLSSYLQRYFNRKPIILIDEYDAPLQYAYSHVFYEKASNFFKRFFSAALKGNEYLEFAVLTGVLRIAKESIFSGLNNLAVYSTLSAEYSDAFGYTPNEVIQITKDFGYENKLNEIKAWYDGYTFGNQEIYNPWSVNYYIDSNCNTAPYWINTADNSILQDLLRHVTTLQLQSLQGLLLDKPIATSLNEGVIYHTIGQDKSALYTLLLNTGYLTASATQTTTDERYLLRIPNEEIKRVYRTEILNSLVMGITRDTFDNLFDALLSGQESIFETLLEQILLRFVSVFDAANKESFYHGFMLGITALFLNREYEVVSNAESGYGRFDVAIFPKQMTRAGVILEFKVASSLDQLPKQSQKALLQIEEKKYVEEFQKRNVRLVWKYGIAFYGKYVKVATSKSSDMNA